MFLESKSTFERQSRVNKKKKSVEVWHTGKAFASLRLFCGWGVEVSGRRDVSTKNCPAAKHMSRPFYTPPPLHLHSQQALQRHYVIRQRVILHWPSPTREVVTLHTRQNLSRCHHPSPSTSA